MKDLIAEAAENAKQVLANVSVAHYSDSTPCSEFDVKTLADHMAGFAVMTAMAANREKMPQQSGEAPDLIGENPGAAYAPLADAAIAAWGNASLDGNVQFGPGEMPAQFAAAITLMELTVHGWDLARATGQDYQMSDALASAVFEAVKQTATPESRERGSFGAEVEVGPGASIQEQMLGYSGRDPQWSA